jgi:hypothetical protein
MPDTERSLASLQALLADNQAGAIVAQNVRDFLVTALGGYAMVYLVGGAVAQAVTGTPAKLTAFTADGPEFGANGDHANDQITINTNGIYWVEFSADFETNATGAFVAELRKDGVAEGSLKAETEFEAAGEMRHWHFAGLVSLNAAEVLTVYVSGAAANITVKHARLAVKRIG